MPEETPKEWGEVKLRTVTTRENKDESLKDAGFNHGVQLKQASKSVDPQKTDVSGGECTLYNEIRSRLKKVQQ